MVSSTENETPSRAGSLDLTADTASARGIGMQDLLEAHPSGDIGNGAPPPPPHSRRPAWGGAPGPAHQELHASAAHVGPQHYNHIAHAQPQQVRMQLCPTCNAMSRCVLPAMVAQSGEVSGSLELMQMQTMLRLCMLGIIACADSRKLCY